MTCEQYLEKYPGAELTCSDHREKLRMKMLGREITWNDKISVGTKIGMSKPDSRKKFMDYIESRDISGERNPFFGKHHTEQTIASISQNEERARKISKKKREWWADGRLGMKVEDLFGEEKGKEIRKKISKRMSGKNNPAFGKVYETSGIKVGRYKGRLFRGILEYSFYRQLEDEGLLGSERYEPLRIPYVFEGRDRTYSPDFIIGDRMIEIKPAFLLEDPIIVAKRLAAEKYCSENSLRYEFLTENDINVKSYNELYSDQNVEWIRR